VFAGRTREDAEFQTFDGVRLPFEDVSVDVVFCKSAATSEVWTAPREVHDAVAVLEVGGGIVSRCP
jgi:hypothetical protein